MNRAQEYFDTRQHEVKRYKKFGNVYFRPAGLQEMLCTMVSGRLETIKKAKLGEIIIKNLELGTSAEQFIMGDKAHFESRYDITDQTIFLDGNNWGVARAKGELDGVVYHGERFVFVAPWGSYMECLDGDVIGKLPTEDSSKVYRIDANSMEKTYKEVK